MCETVAEARRLAFMGPERHKVVALDGTLIAKAGLITGGITGNEAARASRWDDHALDCLKAVRTCSPPYKLIWDDARLIASRRCGTKLHLSLN